MDLLTKVVEELRLYQEKGVEPKTEQAKAIIAEQKRLEADYKVTQSKLVSKLEGLQLCKDNFQEDYELGPEFCTEAFHGYCEAIAKAVVSVAQALQVELMPAAVEKFFSIELVKKLFSLHRSESEVVVNAAAKELKENLAELGWPKRDVEAQLEADSQFEDPPEGCRDAEVLVKIRLKYQAEIGDEPTNFEGAPSAEDVENFLNDALDRESRNSHLDVDWDHVELVILRNFAID